MSRLDPITLKRVCVEARRQYCASDQVIPVHYLDLLALYQDSTPDTFQALEFYLLHKKTKSIQFPSERFVRPVPTQELFCRFVGGFRDGVTPYLDTLLSKPLNDLSRFEIYYLVGAGFLVPKEIFDEICFHPVDPYENPIT